MPVSDKQKQYADKYIKNNFDEIKVRVPKGKKEIIKGFAQTNNESLNGFLNRIINEAMGIEADQHEAEE